MVAAHVPPEILDLLRRAVRLPRGLALLHAAPLETAAVLLSVPPDLVLKARESLDDQAARAAVLEEWHRVHAAAPAPAFQHAAPLPAHPAPDAAAVAAEAERHPLGARFVLDAPEEAVAILFRVHPSVVIAARELLVRRGHASSRPDAEDAGAEPGM